MAKRSIFKPKNNEQEAAVKAAVHFIDAGDPASFFTLMGKAGTGKTTTVGGIIEKYIGVKNIVIAALSHKAKLVLGNKMKDHYGRNAPDMETIASLLGMERDEETGNFYFKNSGEGDPPINYADLIIIDECSQVNEVALSYIMNRKRPFCKVIFVGDIGQLPPIRDKADRINPDTPSPTFTTRFIARLHERIRQGEESPILPYADLFWNNSQSVSPVLNPANNGHRISQVTRKGSVVFSKSRNAIEKVIPLYRKAIETGNHDIVRSIAYQNKIRQSMNRIIRKHLFLEESLSEYVPGELISFTDNYGKGPGKISNSTEAQVKEVEDNITLDGWKTYNLTVNIGTRPRILQVISDEHAVQYADYISDLAERAKSLQGSSRSEAWSKFWEEKERFAPIDYGYAITAHKSQGSTYDVALIAEADIMGLPLSNKTKSLAIYTGITRSKHISIIMDGTNDHPDQMHEAFNLLKTQRNES